MAFTGEWVGPLDSHECMKHLGPIFHGFLGCKGTGCVGRGHLEAWRIIPAFEKCYNNHG